MNIDDDLKLMAEFLKNKRLSLNLSPEDVSIKTGLKLNRIKEIEAGKSDFVLRELNKFAEVYNIKMVFEKR
mgnify:CR=1 FL=1